MVENESAIESTYVPVSRDNLAIRVAAQIEKAILTGQVMPGGRIPSERRLAQLLGVSRVVVREAMKLLQARGMVEIHTGRGVFAAELKSSAITEPLGVYLQQQEAHLCDLQEVRRALETSMTVAAAERATPEDLQRMVRATDEHQKALDAIQVEGLNGHAFQSFVYADVEFHYAVALASHNPLFALLIETLSDLMLDIRRKASPDIEPIRRALDYHTKIRQAIEERDPTAAKSHMMEHLADVEQTAGDLNLEF